MVNFRLHIAGPGGTGKSEVLKSPYSFSSIWW